MVCPPRSGLAAATLASSLSLIINLTGCAGLLLENDGDRPATARPLPPGIRLTVGQLPSSGGCRLTYSRYQPAQPTTTAPVIIGHGFLRSRHRMTDLAIALAANGIPAATLDFCNMRPWTGAHVQNGRDMLALARHLDASPVIYAGFSAGGLAALLAARMDAASLGVLTLDLVDSQGLGTAAARRLRVPLLGLQGEPTNCNAQDNAQAIFAASPLARMQRIPGASHCDFESPTDRWCLLVCTTPPPAPPADASEPAPLPAQILAMATRAVQSLQAGTPIAIGPAMALAGETLLISRQGKVGRVPRRRIQTEVAVRSEGMAADQQLAYPLPVERAE
ncbi:MAG: alpha/beta hydrolase [Chromatiaceae bacterium]|nr:MAG: alpha/beta hydrolase [Chromatiaceae bacterium]